MTTQTHYKPGNKIGDRFLVFKALAGGMSEVYLCLDTEEGEPVALKTLQKRYLQGSRGHTLFKEEVVNWMSLGHHPHIVRCFGVVLLDGCPFFMLEWVAGSDSYGTDLRSWLRGGSLDTRIALEFAIDICRGLVHIEDRGLMHRDLKPDNILVDRGRVAKITDFGLSRIMQKISDQMLNPSLSTSVVSFGGISGTPPYMAPEQWLGQDIDIRTDIYSLGCILYEMLTGLRPFNAHSQTDFEYQHNSAPIPKLPVSSALFSDLNRILERCLAKQSSNRYEDAKTLFQTLTAIYQRHFSREPRLIPLDEELDAFHYLGRAATYMNIQRYDEALTDIDRALQLESNLEIAYFLRAGLYIDLLEIDKALEDLEKCSSIASEIPDFYTLRGMAYGNINRYEDALQDINFAIGLAPYSCIAYATRGYIYMNLYRTQEALADFNRAEELDPNFPFVYLNRCAVYSSLQRFDKAITDLNKAQSLIPYMPPLFEVMFFVNQGTIQAGMRQFEESLKNFDKAISLNPNFAQIYALRGDVYLQSLEFDKAKQDINKAIRLAPEHPLGYIARASFYLVQQQFNKSLSDIDHAMQLAPQIAHAYIVRANIYVQQRAFDEALTNVNKAIELEPDTAIAYTIRGGIYIELGQPAIAVSDLERSLTLFPQEPLTYTYLGGAYVMLLQPDKALAALNKVFELTPIPSPFHATAVYINRGVAYSMQEDYHSAIADLNLAVELALTPGAKAQSHAVRAAILLDIGEYDMVKADLELALRLAPEHPQAYVIMGALMNKIGNYQEANAFFDAAKRLGMPQNAFTSAIAEGSLEDKFEQAFEVLADVRGFNDMQAAVAKNPILIDPRFLGFLEQILEMEPIPPEEEAEILEVIGWLNQIAREAGTVPTVAVSDETLAISALLEANSMEELETAVQKYPMIVEDVFITSVEQTIMPDIPAEYRSDVQGKLGVLRQMSTQKMNNVTASEEDIIEVAFGAFMAVQSAHDMVRCVREFPILQDVDFINVMANDIFAELPHQLRPILKERLDWLYQALK